MVRRGQVGQVRVRNGLVRQGESGPGMVGLGLFRVRHAPARSGQARYGVVRDSQESGMVGLCRARQSLFWSSAVWSGAVCQCMTVQGVVWCGR